MSEEPTQPYDDQQGELLLAGYDWLAIACNVIQTLALIVIAVALVAR